MILSSLELNEFIVEPWMELESFDPKLIKKSNLIILIKFFYGFFTNITQVTAIGMKMMPTQIVKVTMTMSSIFTSGC